MHSVKLLAFDLWGDFALFRMPYTTTSSLTYRLPPKTAIAGLCAAIVGKNRDTYYNLFNGFHYGMKLISNLRTTLMPTNYINTKSGRYLWDSIGEPRTQIKAEVLVDPRYRIYVSFDDDQFHSALKDHLVSHKSHYGIYLGAAQMLANFGSVTEYQDLEPLPVQDTQVATAVPEKSGAKLRTHHKIIRENLPWGMNDKREPSMETILFDGCPRVDQEYIPENHFLTITKGEYYSTPEGNIVLC